ncbi:MAG: DUF3179 domain-containing protein [Pirellulales bacterium]|nr:DUF3179 domain-containing protein [Pirellulales bacterium]
MPARSLFVFRNSHLIRLGLLAIPLAGAFLFSTKMCLRASTSYRSAPGNPTGFEQARPADSEHHGPLLMVLDVPGVQDPEFQPIEQTELSPETEVIGIEVNEKAYAFVVEALSQRGKHIVNLTVDGKPLSVTYCSLSRCTRVLTTPTDSPGWDGKAIDLRVGGLDRDERMVLLLAETRYAHQSDQLPLQDVPFKRVKLSEWEGSHPESLIFSGSAVQ